MAKMKKAASAVVTVETLVPILRDMFFDPARCRDFWYVSSPEQKARELIERASAANTKSDSGST